MTRPAAVRSGGGPRHHLGAALAERVQAEIVAAGWPVGTLIGSEGELCRRYGVGRGTFREAARLLEHHQVARMQRGRSGGLVVTAPSGHSVTTALAVWVEYANPPLADVHTVRRVLEALVVHRAALHIDDDEIASLRQLYDEELTTNPDPHTAHLQHQRLHQVLARASRNPALEVFVDALTRLIERTPSAFDLYQARGDEIEDAVRTIHRRIGDAVIAGDVPTAHRLMVRHLRAIERTQAAQGGTQRRASGLLFSPEPVGRRADEVAWAIHDEIRDARWPVGSVVGSQAELMARYGVGRAVFREAVRLLEDHSVARMKKGPGGGLVTMAPDEQAVVQTVSRYLRYSGIAPVDLLEVRAVLELSAVQAAATAPHHGVDRLAELAEAGAGDPYSFHRELAALAGNRVLSLFMEVLIGLWRECVDGDADGDGHGPMAAGPRPATADAADLVGGAQERHRAIAAAVARGDDVLARRMVIRDATRWCSPGAARAGSLVALEGAAG